eukprot:NODE_369_length_9975_cov_0.256582.p1 type:complete len:395 gc:universal NODE_369_length_9975_cov_0.256582:2577-3761(+)
MPSEISVKRIIGTMNTHNPDKCFTQVRSLIVSDKFAPCWACNMKFQLSNSNRDAFTSLCLLVGYNSITDINYFTSIMLRLCNVKLTKKSLNMDLATYFRIKERNGIEISSKTFMSVEYKIFGNSPYILTQRKYESIEDRIRLLLPPTIRIKSKVFEDLYEALYNDAIPENYMEFMVVLSGKSKLIGYFEPYKRPEYKYHNLDDYFRDVSTECSNFVTIEDMREFTLKLYNHFRKSNCLSYSITHYDPFDSDQYDENTAESAVLDDPIYIEQGYRDTHGNEGSYEMVTEHGYLATVKNNAEAFDQKTQVVESSIYDQSTCEPGNGKKTKDFTFSENDRTMKRLYILRMEKESICKVAFQLSTHRKIIAEIFEIHKSNYEEFNDLCDEISGTGILW